MQDTEARTESSERAPRVLALAVLRASAILGLSQRDLAAVLGVSEATVSRMTRDRGIDPSSKEGELSLLLLRAFRGLDALTGGDERRCRAWFQSDNHHLGGVPARRVRTIQGLMHVVEYLDAMRGRS